MKSLLVSVAGHLSNCCVYFFFSPKQKIGSGYIGTFYLPVAILSSVLSRCVMQLLYSVGVFFSSSSSIRFLHPILVCKRLNNLLHVLLTENSLRKTPLIATLFNLLPFLSIFLFYFSFFFQTKIFFFTFSTTKLSFFPTQLQHCLSNTSLYLFIILLACQPNCFLGGEIFCSLLFQMHLDVYTMA